MTTKNVKTEWKRGLPPGKYYPDMINDYEVHFAPLAKWHRKRSHEEKAAYIKAVEENHRAKTNR